MGSRLSSVILIVAFVAGACASADAEETSSSLVADTETVEADSLAFADDEFGVAGSAATNADADNERVSQDPTGSSTVAANGSSSTSTTSPPTLTPSTTPSTTTPSTTIAPTSTTLAVSATDVDCVTGAFSVSPADPALNKIASIDLTRNGAVIETIPPSQDGNYHLQVTDSAETVAAILNIDNGGITSTVAVTTGGCSGVFGGSYQVCNGEAILVAYPHSWYSQNELTGDPFCSYFRSGPEDGHSDHDITLVSYPGATIAGLTPSDLTSTAGVVVLADDALASVGPYLNRPGRRIDLAHPSDPGAMWKRYYLFDASGFATGLQVEVGASAATDATDVLDAMVATLSVFEH